MTYEEKFEIIVEAIREAKKYTPEGYDTKLKITDENRLLDLDLDDIGSVIYQLENTHKVIKAISTANVKSITGIDPWSDEQDFFALQVLPAFEAWYEEYILEQKTNIKNLDYINLLRIYDVVLDINEQVQLTHKTTVSIHLLPSIIRFSVLFPGDTIGMRDKYCEARWDSLEYLKQKDVIEEFKHNDTFHRWDTVVTLSFKLSAFDDFYRAIRDEYVKRNKSDEKTNSEKATGDTKQVTKELPEEKSEVVYEITYTKQRQILMNNAQIGKPDFNSENDLVFSFLYAHPNESVTKEQIEKVVGSKLNKSLHKIVENLGFEGDTREVFLSVSKNAIQFRNPITKKDLEEMKKPLIKTVKGGGKLLLPR